MDGHWHVIDRLFLTEPAQEIFSLGKFNEMTKLVLTPNATQVFRKHSAELTRVRVVAPFEHEPSSVHAETYSP